jgi:ERCC4-related helicase
MKHLRKYKIFESNTEIDEICKKYDIVNYTINSDNSVDVDGYVDLYNKRLESIPLNFNIVNGYFNFWL